MSKFPLKGAYHKAENNEKRAIQRVKEGEIEEFSIIVNKYTKIILTYINNVVFDKNEVEDLVQNTFIQFYKNIEKFDDSRPVLPYLYQIAKNEVRMYIRSKKSVVPLNDDLDMSVKDEEKETDVEQVLDQLSSEQKKALQLVYEGHSYKEISKSLKRPINTVRTIIRRARLLVKKNYGKT